MSLGLGLGLGISGVATAPAANSPIMVAKALFGLSLVLAVDTDHVTTSGGSILTAIDQSGAGNTLTSTGTIVLSMGGIKGRPFATMPNVSPPTLGMASALVAAGADRTVYHVFQSVTSSQTLLRFCAGVPDYAIRFSAGLGTTSDEASFNNTGTYTYDTTSVHIVESQYHLATISPYWLDGVLVTQTASPSTLDAGSAGFQINGGAAPRGQIWYATYVVNRLTTGPEDASFLASLQGAY